MRIFFVPTKWIKTVKQRSEFSQNPKKIIFKNSCDIFTKPKKIHRIFKPWDAIKIGLNSWFWLAFQQRMPSLRLLGIGIPCSWALNRAFMLPFRNWVSNETSAQRIQFEVFNLLQGKNKIIKRSNWKKLREISGNTSTAIHADWFEKNLPVNLL